MDRSTPINNTYQLTTFVKEVKRKNKLEALNQAHISIELFDNGTCIKP